MRIQLTTINLKDGREINFPANKAPMIFADDKTPERLSKRISAEIPPSSQWSSIVAVILP